MKKCRTQIDDFTPFTTTDLNGAVDEMAKLAAAHPELKVPEEEKKPKMRAASLARRESIVSAARELFETKGLKATNIQDITVHAGITRSLFYHYFSDKLAVTDAVIDTFIDEYINDVNRWSQVYVIGDRESAVTGLLKIMRTHFFSENPFLASLSDPSNSALHVSMVNKASERTARFVIGSFMKNYCASHELDINHIYETLYVLFLGLFNYLHAHPDASDDVLKELVLQTVHVSARDSFSEVEQAVESALN